MRQRREFKKQLKLQQKYSFKIKIMHFWILVLNYFITRATISLLSYYSPHFIIQTTFYLFYHFSLILLISSSKPHSTYFFAFSLILLILSSKPHSTYFIILALFSSFYHPNHILLILSF